MITTQILTKNNEKTIENCLNSIKNLNGEIIIVDLGSDDNTISICEKNGIFPQKIKTRDRSKIRNFCIKNAKNDWIFYIEPWEILKIGHNKILNSINEQANAYKLMILNSNVINKEIRLWNKRLNYKFKNPVYEYLDCEKYTIESDILIISNGNNSINIENWKKECPNSKEVIYYEAITLLTEKKYNEFESVANRYLFREHKDIMSMVMIKYYLASIYCYIKKDAKKAIEHILHCIYYNCLMAEFWCLLGDIHYTLIKDYKKAIKFYDNALVLGNKRLKNDDWPMDINKYKNYPNEMIKNCKILIENTKIYIL